MGNRNRKKTDETNPLEEAESAYRCAVALMARSLVSDMFAQHRLCTLKICRNAKNCRAYDGGGFCGVELDNRQACVFAGMMAFHDAFMVEMMGQEPGGRVEA